MYSCDGMVLYLFMTIGRTVVLRDSANPVNIRHFWSMWRILRSLANPGDLWIHHFLFGKLLGAC